MKEEVITPILHLIFLGIHSGLEEVKTDMADIL